MAKTKNNWILPLVIGAGALFFLTKSIGVSANESPFSGFTPSTLQSGSFVSPFGGTYTPEKDPVEALRYAPQLNQEALVLQSMAQQKGRELTAREILPVTSGLTPQETKTAILLSSPKTLKSYSAVVKGTTTVTPSKKDSSGYTSTDRAVRSSSKYVGSTWTSGGI